MRARGWFVLALVLLCALPARAELRRPSLHWTRGEGASACIDPFTLAERVEALTGPVFIAPFDYAIEGHIDAKPGGWTMRLTVTGEDRAPRGERVLDHQGADCRAFDDALVFLIALTVDPDLDLERLTRDSSLVGHAPDDVLLAELDAHPPQPARVQPLRPKPPLPPPVRAAQSRPWDGSVAVLVGGGELPEPAVGGSLGVQVPLWRWLEVGGQLRVSATIREARLIEDRALRAQTFALAPLLCARAELVALRGCIGPEPSLLRARGVGFEPNERVLLSAWGALAKLEYALPLRNAWSLSVQAFVRLNFERKQLTYTNVFGDQPAHALQRFSGGAAIGVSYRFRSGIASPAGTNLQNEREVEP